MDRKSYDKGCAGMKFIHAKSGEAYSFMHVGIDEATLDPCVTYAEARGNRIWTRSAKEFFDGRFVTEEKYQRMQEEAALAKNEALRKTSTTRKGGK